MSKLFAYVRPFTSICVRARRSFIMTPQCSSGLLMPVSCSSQFSSITQPGTEEVADEYIKELRSEDEWHKIAYSNLAKNSDPIAADCHKAMEGIQKIKDELLEIKKKNFKKIFADRDLRSIARLKAKTASLLERALDVQGFAHTSSALIELRTGLFLRFRLAARAALEDQLTVKIKKIPKDYFAENISYNLDRDFEYYHFLKQLKSDVESGNLDLSEIGVADSGDFLGICEFALKGDQEAFFQYRPFGNYYIEEEVSDCINQFPDAFDKKGILDLIGKVKMSEPMPGNCVKMADYLSKLI